MITCKPLFPLFQSEKNKSLVYLDSAATTQKPQCVIDAEMQFYREDNANIHRGVYALSERATTQYDHVREKVAHFIHAKHAYEIIFTRGTTESINLVAHSFALQNLKPDDEIILSVMEHHSNIVPWQMACEKTGARLKVIPLLNNTELDLEKFQQALTPKTKLVAMTHISNALGIINPVEKIIEIAHAHHVPVLLDGAQAIAHRAVDVQALDCDFYVFSAHKMYGPTGVGVLYAKESYLEKMVPYQTGGDMIAAVTFEKTTFASLPNKFEAGTPNIAGVIGFGAAIDFILGLGFDAIQSHEVALMTKAAQILSSISDIKIMSDLKNKSSVLAFLFSDVHAHDVATILDQSHIAIRAGHHCAMPLMHYLNVPALCRLSVGIYNLASDLDQLMLGLQKVSEIFACPI
ncbi:MAG: cysteine sulfinate desulfinase [Gammaproteobacteria bacterium RIFCSPLOWO2_02_FULL_42_14]|nr:MAG: cysteine sulfinate desulfinase [Gammaproteobacteria bacterium RIFCSPHIGHO2_02_FULL_42_43]OGT28822.1 MAG: cysteine sulfinate desulfinase [Gammaproteobacteria bacterium RIFCSPHIGHO2_01_FULL_42_8]OGT52244.1 MAG: cysteine sulfinate desulfinase [Gammaproteobacteria bacterium RIFCSPHIGHO2_12_FULL_41_25]OGT61857.1 MAG: cysteine sulfinate desulfinase [Gammaproteobacteria bacterium RIFCSPLOWO2_02_FULL_42_14]OGT86432.1 MAG: cysteine sulfinate desulfinase [Gammaproteobacteria bacterium RIFCSPLOWO2